MIPVQYKWITGGFPHCLGDSVISLFHLSFGLNGWMWCTCHCCPSSWLRQIYFCGSCAVCAAYSWWKAAFVSFCTWLPQDLNQASLSLTGGDVVILTFVHYWLSILHILMEESDLNDRSCEQCKGDQGRTCFLSSSLEVRCLEIKWKASNQSRGHSRTKTALSVYSMNRLL